MKDLLRSLKLITDYTITLDCPKSYFLKKLADNTDPSGFRPFADLSSKLPFKGSVSGDAFKIIKKRDRAENASPVMVEVRGIVMDDKEKTVVNIEANGFNRAYGVYVAAGVVASLILIPILARMSQIPELIWIVFQAMFTLGFPYYLFRRGVAVSQQEMEKEFYFLTRNYKAGQ